MNLISDVNGEKISGSSCEKELQKTIQEKFRIEKVPKVLNCMINGKDLTIHLKVGLIKKACIKMSQYLPKLFRSFGGNINFKVDLSNYATKTDLRNVTHVDTSSFVLKRNLTSVKTEADKLDIGKLTTVPVDLNKLLLKTMLVKKLFMTN